MSVETDAMALARRLFEQDGYAVEDVSRKPGHGGYDLLISCDGLTTKVEVKGSTQPWHIPDAYVTEFDQDKRLVADILCVVYLKDPRRPSVCLIPRDATPPELVKPRMGYRISGRFKKKDVLEKYWRPLHFCVEADGIPDA